MCTHKWFKCYRLLVFVLEIAQQSDTYTKVIIAFNVNIPIVDTSHFPPLQSDM